jgi:hypothetical protein
MPRLVLHGLIPKTKGSSSPHDVRADLTAVLQQMGLGDDAVIEVLYSVVTSCGQERKLQPFLEVLSTDQDRNEADEIADNALVRGVCAAHHLEIEVGAKVRRFIPLNELHELPEPIDERGSS